ncbi:MAG: hypothetical protein FWG98_12110 [Candidatus Cloacimonetes bacterium]|nr:hypothetical protein [Candidatus Cloacimonadota bacterium]
MKKFIYIVFLLILLGCEDVTNLGNPDGSSYISSVTVNPEEIELVRGGTHQFTAVVNGSNNPSQEVTWLVTGSNSGSTITDEGLLTVSITETAAVINVRATSKVDTGKTGSARVVITGSIITDVIVHPNSISIARGESYIFTATVEGTNNPLQSVIWSVSGGSGGTNITSSGLLTVAFNETAHSLIVTARSTTDQTKSGTAIVTIPTIGGTFNVFDINTWNQAINAIRNDGNHKTHTINVSSDISVPFTSGNLFGSVVGIIVTIEGSRTLSLSANGALIQVGTGQTVIVRNIVLKGREGNDNAVVRVESGSLFYMEGESKVIDNISNSNGGGVIVNGGVFIMRDNSSILNNSANGYYSYGGGVFINSGSMTIQGNASITDNIAQNWYNDGEGGGVFVSSQGLLTMSNGSISSNQSNRYGGGVHLASNATMIMENGSIIGNTSGNRGGGVYISQGARLTMNNGSISYNVSSTNSGGGVHVSSGHFIITGGTMMGNSANNNGFGGGVYINSSGSFTKTAGTITGSDMQPPSGNSSSNQGHVAYKQGSPNLWRNTTAGPSDSTEGYGFWRNEIE